MNKSTQEVPIGQRTLPEWENLNWKQRTGVALGFAAVLATGVTSAAESIDAYTPDVLPNAPVYDTSGPVHG